MVEKVMNKYRIESFRLENRDYSWNGSYFITVCTENRIPYFGKILNSTPELTEISEIINKFRLEIPNHCRFQNQSKDATSSIIVSYKLIYTKTINKMQNEVKFARQPRFYDRILRDEKALYNVRNYINNNPIKWNIEKNKSEGSLM
jgi:putative transposase